MTFDCTALVPGIINFTYRNFKYFVNLKYLKKLDKINLNLNVIRGYDNSF